MCAIHCSRAAISSTPTIWFRSSTRCSVRSMSTTGRFPRRLRVWVFPSLVLPGERHLRTSWVGRPGSFKERPQKRSQAYAGSDGVPGNKAKLRTVAEVPSVGRPLEGGIRYPDSPPEHRATTAAGKKTPLRSATASHEPSLSNAALVAGYEELRRQMLIKQRGPGAAVLMRSGLWAWINACSACAPLPTKVSTQSDAAPVVPQGLHAEIVLILAGMLLRGYQEIHA